MKTLRLITCNDAMQAHIIQGALENEGIESVLHNENFSSLMKGYSSEIAGVDIMIVEKDYDKAFDILKNGGFIALERKLCPHCGSADITLKPKKDKKIKMFFAILSSVLLAIPPGNNHWEYRCNQCYERFETPVAEFEPEKN